MHRTGANKTRSQAKEGRIGRAQSYNGGGAFEWLLTVFVAKRGNMAVVQNRRYYQRMRGYEKIRGKRVARTMGAHAWTLACEIVDRFPDLVGPIELLNDARGADGDVCDLEIRRKDGTVLGISCKWNNKELKYPRVSRRTEFFAGWLGVAASSAKFRAALRKKFEIVEREMARHPGKKWADLRKRPWLLAAVAAQLREGLKRRLKEGKIPARKLLSFIYSPRDHCIARGGGKQPTLSFYNPRGTLRPGKIRKTKLPKWITSSFSPHGKPGTFVIGLSGSEGKRGPALRFRLHSAKSTLEASLKCGTTLDEGETPFLETVPADMARARSELERTRLSVDS